jgi:gliding motility-associated-like protein
VLVSSTEVNLTLDYSGITFSGQDQLTIRACDLAGVCTESILAVNVHVIAAEESPVEVFNAVAPNSSGDNRYMRIVNLPQHNKVSIFNRWGDIVFNIVNYDQETPGKRFEGMDNSGKVLTSGTYFYKIEYVDNGVRQTLTGYLSLKQ